MYSFLILQLLCKLFKINLLVKTVFIKNQLKNNTYNNEVALKWFYSAVKQVLINYLVSLRPFTEYRPPKDKLVDERVFLSQLGEVEWANHVAFSSIGRQQIVTYWADCWPADRKVSRQTGGSAVAGVLAVNPRNRNLSTSLLLPIAS